MCFYKTFCVDQIQTLSDFISFNFFSFSLFEQNIGQQYKEHKLKNKEVI